VESVAAAYFAYLALVAILRKKLRAAALSVAALFCVVTVGTPHVMPLVYLLAGYWLPALTVRAPSMAIEQHLLQFDQSLFGADGLARFARSAPRPLIEYLELMYLLCYAVVPAGYVCLLMAGHDPPTVERYWSIVLLASFLCYGVLPWVATRAPRTFERRSGPARSWTRRLNVAVLHRASVQWNTFPSGHTGASLAAALAVASDMPVAGVVFGVIAVSIAIASVVGRYHYAADALAGAAVAVVAFLIANGARAL
jgi:membrane-associated phospholipid phosphatase